ncbi:ADP-ribosylation factor-like protein 2 [Armadillidium vulgare]|nr:ADP-ribosylation factor-like protein 2 [Armadillidium vulgare]
MLIKFISGLDNAGKTTVVKRFCGEDINTISPTYGFNIKTVDHTVNNYEYKLNIWDVGGQTSLRSYWRNYFECTDGLIWVVDSSDVDRLEDCRSELKKLLAEEVRNCCYGTENVSRLAGATLLVFANKQDLSDSLNVGQIKEILDLEELKTHHWFILPCSAVTGENLVEGIDWLLKDISARIFTLD